MRKEDRELHRKVTLELGMLLNGSQDTLRPLAVVMAARFPKEFLACVEKPPVEIPKGGLDPRFTEEQQREVIGYIREGKKIAAVKAYRQFSGMGLGDCKTAVERYMAENNIR